MGRFYLQKELKLGPNHFVWQLLSEMHIQAAPINGQKRIRNHLVEHHFLIALILHFIIFHITNHQL